MASTALVNQIAPPERRAEVMAAYFASGYCGPSPIVAIGPTSAWIGTADATLGCAIATAALAAATLLGRTGVRKTGAPAVAWTARAPLSSRGPCSRAASERLRR